MLSALTKGDETNEGDVHLFTCDGDDLKNCGRLDDVLAGLYGQHDEPEIMLAVVSMLRRHADRLEAEALAFAATRQ